MRRTSILPIVLAAALIVETTVLGFLSLRQAWARAASGSPVERGRRVAETMGCFGCHGPGGGQPIPNPGARGGEVPTWTGGTWMMWNRTEGDVRTWILEGGLPDRPRDPDALIRMPAYKRFLAARELEDLVAYVLAVSQFGPPPSEAVGAGRDAATRLGCFGCHGPEGRGLIRNPRSFTGYIPPWDGPDYAELVRDAAEFREWVKNGVSDRFRANPVASAFLEGQAIPMPAYGERVTDVEIEALQAYVQWVRATPRGAR